MTATSYVRRYFSQTLPLIAIAFMAMANGMYFSPVFDSLLFLLPRGAAMFFVRDHTAMFYATGLLLWLMTMLVAGIPAALYERIRGLPSSTPVSLGIWFAATVGLAYPSLMAAYELFTD